MWQSFSESPQSFRRRQNRQETGKDNYNTGNLQVTVGFLPLHNGGNLSLLLLWMKSSDFINRITKSSKRKLLQRTLLSSEFFLQMSDDLDWRETEKGKKY
jgi:hypothetical protein